MDTSSMPDDVWIEYGPRMFVALIGGDIVWGIVLDHWRGLSLRQIGEKYDVDHTTARRWIRQAKVKMREAGLNADAVRGYAERHAGTEACGV